MNVIKQKEYARRRRQLMRRAGEDSIIILQAAPARIRNNDAHYAYRQDSDFLYLTGFREHDALLVMIPDGDAGRSILFCRERDPTREMWDGRMVGLESAVEDYGMDEAFDIKEADQRLRDLLPDRERIYHDLGRDPLFDQRLIGWLNEFRGTARKTFHAPEEIHALHDMLHDMRVYKSREELSVMRRSAKVAIEAHETAMRTCVPGMSEADIHAGLMHTFIRNHCEASYLPIVAGGGGGVYRLRLRLQRLDTSQPYPGQWPGAVLCLRVCRPRRTADHRYPRVARCWRCACVRNPVSVRLGCLLRHACQRRAGATGQRHDACLDQLRPLR